MITKFPFGMIHDPHFASRKMVTWLHAKTLDDLIRYYESLIVNISAWGLDSGCRRLNIKTHVLHDRIVKRHGLTRANLIAAHLAEELGVEF